MKSLLVLLLSNFLYAMCPSWPPIEPLESIATPKGVQKCAALSPNEALEKADLVFIGKTVEQSYTSHPRLATADKGAPVKIKPCKLKRQVQVIKVLKGKAPRNITFNTEEYCAGWGCPPLLSKPEAWLIYAKKEKDRWVFDSCLAFAVAEPYPTLEDLQVRYEWKKALLAKGIHPWEKPRFVRHNASQIFQGTDFSYFRTTEILPKLSQVIPYLEECGLFDLNEPHRKEDFFEMEVEIETFGNVDTLKPELYGSRPDYFYNCLKSRWGAVTFPQPRNPKRNSFSLRLKYSPIPTRKPASLEANKGSLLFIGATDPVDQEVGHLLGHQPQVFNKCRPEAKDKWIFAAQISFDIDEKGNVVKGTPQVRPYTFKKYPASVACIQQELEKVHFKLKERGAHKVSFVARVLPNKAKTALQ